MRTSTVTTVLAGQHPKGPKSGNGVPEVDMKVQEVGHEVPGFGYKVRRSDTKSEGCRLILKGVHKWPKARHEGFWDSTRRVRD